MHPVDSTVPVHADSTAPPPAGVWTVVFLGVTAGIQMSDRGLQSILSPAIKASFGVSDSVIGALHGVAGILVASMLAVPLARLVDFHSRKRILLGLIALWCVLTALGALSPNFPLFFLGRSASGVTEFAMIPIVYSMIPDLVKERHRVPANLGFAALMAIGASAGFYFGGTLLDFATRIAPPWLEPWRLSLLILALAGLPLLAAGLLVTDPPRNHGQSPDGGEEGGAARLLPILRARQRSILLFLGSAGGLAIAIQATTPMAPLALVRRYAADLGPTGHALGIITLIASLASLPMAGIIDRLLQSRMDERGRPAIMATGALLAIPCLVIMGAAATERLAIAMIALFLLVTCVANALIPTILQDIVPPGLRAQGFAVYSVVIAGFCALGPLLSGLVSDYVVRGDLLRAISFTGVPALALAMLCSAAVVFGHARRRQPAEATAQPAEAAIHPAPATAQPAPATPQPAPATPQTAQPAAQPAQATA